MATRSAYVYEYDGKDYVQVSENMGTVTFRGLQSVDFVTASKLSVSGEKVSHPSVTDFISLSREVEIPEEWFFRT